MREIADRREHGTTAEAPLERFLREEAATLRRLDGRPPFRQVRDLIRRVQANGCVEVDTDASSVPWRVIGETVRWWWLSIEHRGQEVAVHGETAGLRQRLIEPAHFAGMLSQRLAPISAVPAGRPRPDQLRSWMNTNGCAGEAGDGGRPR